jgi:excinuclease ABC subunit C
LQFEYARELRDRAEALETVRTELLMLRRSIESLSFIYEVPGHGGEDRLYVVRRGVIRAELLVPAAENARLQTLELALGILNRGERETASLRPDHAAEALLLARWFRLRPQELERTRGGDAARALASARLLSAV